MKITIVCANGRAGKLILEEAVNRGHEVTAIVRNNRDLPDTVNIIEKDLFDITLNDVKSSNVVINAFGAWTEETLPSLPAATKHLSDILSGSDIRLLVVGGAGSLYVNQEHTLCVEDGPDFPDIFKPVSAAHGETLRALRVRNDVLWTYLSPAGDFQADGIRSGKYILGGEELTLNSKGESVISYADYAIAMVDEAENGNYIQKRFSVVADY